MTTDPSPPGGGATGRTRRRHAATGGRILAGGASAAATLALMGAMAQATATGVPAPTIDPDEASSIVIRRFAGTPTEVARGASPPVTTTAEAPVTTSQGS